MPSSPLMGKESQVEKVSLLAQRQKKEGSGTLCGGTQIEQCAEGSSNRLGGTTERASFWAMEIFFYYPFSSVTHSKPIDFKLSGRSNT